MPRVLRLWAFPMPQDYADAVRIAGELQQQERPANRNFERFAAWADAQPVPPGSWAHGIVGGRSDRPIARVAIRDDQAAALVPQAIEAATSLGLIVLDEAGDGCHLPAGVTLGQDGRRRVGAHLGAVLQGPLTPALAERTLLDALEPLLGSVGFERSPAVGGFGRRHEAGTQWVRWLPRAPEAEGAVAFDLQIAIVLDPIRTAMDALLPMVFPGEKHSVTATGSLGTMAAFERMESPSLKKRATQWFEVTTVDELRALAIALRGLVADVLRPLLDAWRDPQRVAWQVTEVGFDAWRIVGHETTVDDQGIRSATFGGRLLHVHDSGTPVTELVLAAVTDAPAFVIERVLGDVRQRIEALPAARREAERRLLDEALTALQGAGLIAGAGGEPAPQ